MTDLSEPSPVQRLRAGVIGLGWAGQQHMIGYAATEGVDLVALAGMETDQLARLGNEYGIDPDLRCVDWRDLLTRGDLDVVTIATPTTLHQPMAVAALDAGIHVLSEKPIAENGAAAAEMVAAATRNGRVLDVSFNHRQRGDVRALKKLVDDGRLGRLYYAKTGWIRRTGIPGMGSWFTRRATAGGGPLMDIGVHMLDIALHLLGEPGVQTTTATTYAEFGPLGRGGSPEMVKSGVSAEAFDVEDLATAFLRLSGGQTLLLESSWAQWIPRDVAYVTLFGADGGATLEWGGGPADPWRTLDVWTEIEGVPARLEPLVGPHGLHTACIEEFLAKVRSGDFAAHRGQQALALAEVVDACYASADQGQEICLSQH